MSTASESVTKCYIGHQENLVLDPFLEGHGFARTIISFAVPSQGVLFRCRAGGSSLDLEFAALFALLKFLKESARKGSLSRLQILSSYPEFIFAFTGSTPHLHRGSARELLLREYNHRFKMRIGYVEPINNRAYILTSDFPSFPSDREAELNPDPGSPGSEFKPYQRGVDFT
jgi:hypothetical protein